MPDDAPLYKVVRDLSGGMNSRQGEQIIKENEATVLQNVELNVAGERSVRLGMTRIDSTYPATAGAGLGLFGFEPESSSAGTNVILTMLSPSAGTSASIWRYKGSGALSACANASGWTALRTTMVKALESDEAEVVIIQNGTDNAFRMTEAFAFENLGDTNTSPPKTKVMNYYRDRLFCLLDNKLYWSEAVTSAYSAAFDRANDYYNIPVGIERALMGTRDYGLVTFGSQNIYQINPSIIPDASKDKPEFVLDIGCANGDTVKQVADDIFYLAYDGVRAVRRTVQDKLQSGQSQPLSWNLKTEFDLINWAYIQNADAVYYKDKYILSLPSGSSTTNNQLWIYYPALNAWSIVTGQNIVKFATIKFSNDQRLYGLDAVNGKLYRMFYGTNDDDTTIVYQEEGRAEDFGKPLQFKSGGEFKIKVRGSGATLTPTADIGEGYVAITGDPLTIAEGGLSFPFDFPFNFASIKAEGVWHLDNLGKFKTIKFKILCNTKDAEFIIKETIATTFGEEYISEDA
jgi:hypothetical protein